MSNPRLQRLIGRRAAMRFGAAAPSPSFLSYAGAQSVNADGWTFQDNDNEPVNVWGTNQAVDGDGVPANNYDPVGDPKIIHVSAPGYTATGAATTVIDALYAMSRLRQAHPNSGLWEAAVGGEVQSTLSGMVHSSDDLHDAAGVPGGLTNNSLRNYAKPGAVWRYPDLRVVVGDTLDIGLYAAHKYARNGAPLAAVKFIVSDGVNSVEQIVAYTAMTGVQHASGLFAPWFQAAVDISSLNNGECTIDVEMYAWRSHKVWKASVDYSPDRDINFCRQTFYHDGDGSFQNVHAIVDGASTGASATTYTTEAAMDAAYAGDVNVAYPSVSAAMSAARTAAGNVFGKIVVYLVDGTYTKNNWGNVVDAGGFPVTLTRYSGSTNRASVIVQTAAGGGASDMPRPFRFYELTLHQTTTIAITFQGRAVQTNKADDRVLIFDHCTRTKDSDGWGATFYQWHRVFTHECDGVKANWENPFSGNEAYAAIDVGSVNWIGPHYAHGIASKRVQQVEWTDGSNRPIVRSNGWSGAAQMDWADGEPIVFGHCFFGRADDTQVVADFNFTNLDGLYLPCSIFEKQVAGSQTCVIVSGDGITNEMTNVGLICSTVVGQRINIGYNDTGSVPIPKDGYLRFCVTTATYNSKDDAFGPENGGRWAGNGPVQYRVDFRSNAHLDGAVSGKFFAPGNYWLGEVAALGDVAGSLATPLDADWMNDQSSQGGAAGDGDYTPGVNHQLPLIPAGMAPYPIDQRGRPIPNDGTAVVGALQMAA